MADRNHYPLITELIELYREISSQQFEAVIRQLTKSFPAFTGLDFQSLYEVLKNKNGSVLGQDIIKIFNNCKQQAEFHAKISEEVDYYQTTINKMLKTGRKNLSFGEFLLQFSINNPSLGLVTVEVQNKLRGYRLISLNQLSVIIEKVVYDKLQFNQQSTFKNEQQMLQIDKKCQSVIENESDLQEQIQQIQQIMLNFTGIEREKIKNIISHIKDNIKESQQQIEVLERKNRQHTIKQQHLHEQVYQLQLLISQKDSTIIKISQEHQKMESQFQTQRNDNHSIQQVTNEELLKQNKLLTQQNQQLCEQIRELKQTNFKQNEEFQLQQHMGQSHFMDLETENTRLVEQELEKQLVQLNDQVHELRMENLELKNKISDLEQALEVLIVSQLRKQQKSEQPNTSNPIEKISNLSCEQITQHFLHSRSIRKQSAQLQMIDQISKNFHNNKPNRLFRLGTKQFLPTEQTEWRDECKEVTNITAHDLKLVTRRQIFEFDFAGVLNSKIFNGLRVLLENSHQSVINIKQIFSSYVQIIKTSKNRLRAVLIISSQKILFCNSISLEVIYSLKIDKLRSMIFCSSLRSILVLVFKELMILENQKPMSELIIQIYNRSELLNFMSQSGFHKLHPLTTLQFQVQDKIQVIDNRQIKTIQNIDETKNIIFACINDGKNMFEAKLITNFAFFTKNRSIFSILVFQQAKYRHFNKINEDLKAKFILPFCKQLEIITLNQQNKIKFTYLSLQLSYTFELGSLALVSLFYRNIKALIRLKNEQKQKQEAKYTTKTSSLTNIIPQQFNE